MFALDKWII